MTNYKDNQALRTEIQKSAHLFINEFIDIEESAIDIKYTQVDRTPREMLAYQLGWMHLITKWESDEMAGKKVVTPSENHKWNKLGDLYQSFYLTYNGKTLTELIEKFNTDVQVITEWVTRLSYNELFEQGVRKWASSTKSNWPVWKWVHINTVAPFKSFRGKIRKWKKIHHTTI